MAEKFLISKALDLSPTALGKSTTATIKGLFVLLAIGGLLWAIYLAFIKPHFSPLPTTTQKAETIVNTTNNYPERKNLLDFDAFWGWVHLGLGPQRDVNKK